MNYSLIDTVKFSVNINHTKWINEQGKRHAQGSVDPISTACASQYHNKKFKVAGFYQSSASVWSKRNGTILMIECSAPKFLTGQNVFGDDRLINLIFKITKHICKNLGIEPTLLENEAIIEGNVRIYRVDLATYLKPPVEISTSDFIQALKFQLAFTQRSFSTYSNESIYIDQGSDLKSLKIYDKYKEVLIHKLPENLPEKDKILVYTKNMLRVEITFRNRFLKKNSLDLAKNISAKKLRYFMKQMIKDLCLSDESLLQPKTHHNLGSIQKLLLSLHSADVNIRSLLSDRQLKEHAKQILKNTGINILSPHTKNELSKIPVKTIMKNIKFKTVKK